MKSVTIREAQHNLAKILKDVERGETVEILRRSVPVARLSPVDSVEPEVKPVDWTWVEERRRKIWGDRCITTMDEILDDLRGERRPCSIWTQGLH